MTRVTRLATDVGPAGLLLAPDRRILLAVPLYAWMVLPGLGYVHTARAVVGVGQTAGIVTAAVGNAGGGASADDRGRSA